MTKLFKFPVGYHNFHEEKNFNFQMNRWYSSGYLKYEDLKEAGKKIKNYEDCITVMEDLADQKLKEDKKIEAAFYYRFADFFTKNKKKKELLYDKFMHLFYDYLEEHGLKEKVKRHYIPYEEGNLYAIRVKPDQKIKGVIVIHGGGDSYIEEFYSSFRYFLNEGYEVIAFEGPGQGRPLHKHGLTFLPEWEKPTSTVLDYFNLDDVTLIGISFGGYLALRAAAFEKRIKRVIAYDIVYDWLDCATSKGGWFSGNMIKFALKFEIKSLINKAVYLKMEQDTWTRWGMENSMFTNGLDTPYELFKSWERYSLKDISEKIEQDVLLMAGENDHSIPIEMYYKQKKALTNANSIEGRIFTKKEHAASHCQVGNLKLALTYILNWIDQFH